ncbi:T7SS effector LXG polymorphic toxin [Bacillus licheniformis]|uniref:ribonuclease YeeF family protein n=1 Tax=Bacillus licheniformis TaxID=1402 RepID=UPI00228151AA|nr:T7SS effector LXG polymorphic toxin [Bacillus licheniformis]MCY7774456.1 T7SS effector LXG polymorphic toxin [Bacillus licheniformis]MCY7953862.1 T7SS effector LXG polymorphic toxin [Bacillus licheniformis]MCY8528104.1 T7SS effector LXG polymorphic toxin [Bacillus licheniformis]MCY8742655.1 T7SS effector LXG polymorphic toxin [Bacillus licheniformis]MCY9221595.1 T7SS effector LXG polymorphic toxin [Bacillus licheniformis]
MKTLDVQALHNAIDQTLEQLKHQSDEFAKVKKAVEGITSLDDALKGKGGDAIRAFYEECHTPFLQFYDTFIEEYSSTLKKIKSALNSLEPNHNGFISQSFLEHQLENGLHAADRTTKHLVSKTNATIAKVSHIVDLPDLNDSGFHEQNQKALKEISTTLEKLHAFDRGQTNALKTAENDLETMQRYIARLEKMYTGPKIEITSYQKGAILKPDEMDTLSGNQETAMGVMLKKVGDKKDADVNTLADPDRLKKLATQKVSTKEYTQEELNELKKDYRVFNDTLYRAYIDGDTIVKIEPAYTLPDHVEKSEWEKYLETALEFTGVYDGVRAAFGYDLATGEIVKGSGDRLMAALNVTPFGKAFKYGKHGFKLFKGEEAGKKVAKVDKGSKAAKDVGKVEPTPSKSAKETPKKTSEGKDKVKDFDLSFATSKLKNGKISANDLESMIPKGTPNNFKASETIKKGYKYNFEIDGKKVEVKWHSPDLNAKEKFPDSNSGNMWTAQIKIQKKLLGQDGKLHKKPSNITHIPVVGE